MGLKIVLDTTFTDTSLPKLRPDALITDGSLFLIDMGRSETAPVSTVPAHGSALLNLAWQTAADIIGSGNESTLAGTFENTFVGVPAMGAVERSAKYGLHVISSQTAQDGSNRHGGIAIPAPIVSHVLGALPGSQIYASIWGRITRVATAGVDSIGYLGDVAGATKYAWNFFTQPNQGPPDGSTARVGAMSEPGTNTTGNFFRAICADEWTGVEPVLANTAARWWFGKAGVYASFQTNGAASGIIYRVYIEDLTISGRSYAETVAADKALYDAAMGSGGRFNGDTFTAPSSIP